LQPRTWYSYRLTTSQGPGPTYRFRTLPPAGDRTAPYHFIVYGDQRGQKVHAQLVPRMTQERPDFIICTGDLVNDGTDWSDWRDLFAAASQLYATSPLYPALGNHERDSPTYFDLFRLPKGERYYSVDFGPMHWICLDSNDAHARSAEQVAWLIADLTAHQTYPYIFVFFHHPPYSCAVEDRRGGSRVVRDMWDGIFRQFAVNAVFCGHDHNYQRNVVKGATYVVTGGGGAPLHGVEPMNYTLVAESVHHFMVGDWDGQAMRFRAYRLDGSLLDHFTVSRRQASLNP